MQLNRLYPNACCMNGEEVDAVFSHPSVTDLIAT